MAIEADASAKVVLRSGTVFVAFAGFGLLWGLYVAALPEIKRNSGAGDSQFGTALLCVALAAVPAMFIVGRLLDKAARPVAVVGMASFAVVAALPALTHSVPALVGALLLFGFGSGACDVVINSLAATVEAESGVRVMNRAHALFSAGLLAGSVITGIGRASGMNPWILLVAFGTLSVVGTITTMQGRIPRKFATKRPQTRRRRVDRIVLGFGALAALAMLVESGVQQWSAVFLEDVVHAPIGLSALAPGVFAGSMALGRLGGHWVSVRLSDRTVLLLSGVLSGVGVVVLAVAPSPVIALVGFAIIGAAISVTAPTIYSLVGRRADAERRGATIGLTASVGYIGLLLGPAVVGQVAGVTQLRIAVGSLAVASVAIGIVALRMPPDRPDIEHQV